MQFVGNQFTVSARQSSSVQQTNKFLYAQASQNDFLYKFRVIFQNNFIKLNNFNQLFWTYAVLNPMIWVNIFAIRNSNPK